MTVQFPGYKPVIKNSFYVDSRDKAKGHVIRGVDNTPTGLLIMKYTVPDEAQILHYIQKKAANVSKQPRKKAANGNWDQGIEFMLSSLPGSMVQDIKNSKGPIMAVIAGRICESADHSAYLQTYLQADSGAVADSVISKVRKKKPDEATDAIMSAFGNRVGVSIKLYGGKLPPKGEMDVLRKHGVSKSYSFSVKGDKYSPEADKLVETLYEGLSKPGSIAQVADTSKRAFQEPAGIVLSQIAKAIRLGDVMMASLDALMHISLEPGKRTPAPESLFKSPN